VRLLPLLPSYPFLTTILWPIGYRRTVLVLVHESNAGYALFSTGGIHYALEELRGSEAEPTPPTETNKRLAALVVKYVSCRDKGTLTSMFNLALRWKDSKLWSSVIFNSGANALQSTFVQKQLVKAWKTFGFVDAVQNGYVSCACARTSTYVLNT
jgi:hypothetical protein